MKTPRLVTAAFLVFVACGRKDEPMVTMHIDPPPPKGAERAPAQSAALEPAGNPNGFNPVSLDEAVNVTVEAGGTATVTLPVPDSAQAAWVAIRAAGAATLQLAGRAVHVEGGAVSSWQLVTLEHRRFSVGSDVQVALTVRPAGYFDQSGAGFGFTTEPALEQSLAVGTTPLALAPASATEPDDTWGTWLQLTVSATAGDAVFELRSCENHDALEQLHLGAGATQHALVLAPNGPLCAYASDAVRLEAQPLGRYRRFLKSTWSTVKALPVLDTEQGLGWKGTPLENQSLELDLSKVQGLTGATAAVLRVSGKAVAVGACEGALAALAGTDLVLLDPSTRLCVSTPEKAHLRVELLGVVRPGDAEPLECPARPQAADCAAQDLLGRLNCIAGVSATSSGKPDQYVLQVTQPIDHTRPDGPTFKQRVLLTYGGPTAPITLHTTGYDLFSYRSDLGTHLSSTELEVEHRFFGTSTPMPKDFTRLDIVQSAHDSHRLVELLRPTLQGKWLGTGHSKGGMTTVFHRRFFPCDVDGSVPYVTPLSYSLDDPRYGKPLQEVGGAKYARCRQVFRDIDRAIIAGKATYAPRLRGTYTKVGGPETALWESTGMMSWGLWQYYNPDDPMRGCPAYEAYAADPDSFAQLVDYYAQSGEGYSDQSLAQASSDELFGYTYQTTNELGNQGASRDHLADLGPAPTLPPAEVLMLGSVPQPKYEARSMRDVQEWVKAHGARFIFVYGEFDPWSAGALDIEGARESVKLVAPGGNHGAGFKDLTSLDQTQMDTLLQRWLGNTGPRLLQRAPLPALATQPEFRDVMARYRL
ncbi:MAG: hypothetical protein IPJ65_02410 [Archangiaceae bacterium]|nr:hypothetical protein [Archangiaceae bacterium]